MFGGYVSRFLSFGGLQFASTGIQASVALGHRYLSQVSVFSCFYGSLVKRTRFSIPPSLFMLV